jgi:hypothetical protein
MSTPPSPPQDPVNLLQATASQPEDDTPLPSALSKSKHPHFSAKELFEVIQAALTVKIYEAKHGEKGKREEEMGDLLRKMKILGSNGVFQSRMKEMLTWHKVCRFSTPHLMISNIIGTIES